MIQAKISTFQTVKYNKNELSGMTGDEQLSIKSFGYEKIIKEIEIVNQTFKDIEQLRSQIFELCSKNQVIFVVLGSHTHKGFLVGAQYKYNDPNAIFEIIFSIVLDTYKHSKSVYNNKEKEIINDPDIKEFCRMIGKNMNKITHYARSYARFHDWPNSLNSTSNLIPHGTATFPE